MKALLLIALTLFSTLSFAGEMFICKEVNPVNRYEHHKMVLTQIGNDSLQEGRYYAFKLEVFKGNTLVLVEAVNIKTEDVVVRVTNTAKRIQGTIYMDELEESHFQFGSSKVVFDCR